MPKKFYLEAKELYTPTACLKDACVITDGNGRIDYVGPKAAAPAVEGVQKIQAPGLRLAPGFVDIHVHGGHGIAFGVGDKLAEDLQAYSEWVLESGVTAFVASISAPSGQEAHDLLTKLVPVLEKGTRGARVLGLHMEGPFLNVEKKGAFNPSWLRMPSLDEAKDYIRIAGSWIKQISMAPELPNALEVAREFRKAGITVAMGHTNTDYDTARAALMGDFTHVTHIFNAQSDFNHRAPGVMGAILASDEITGELIADGIHVHPGAMKVLLRCLGTKRVTLITDAIPGAGLPNGDYNLIGQVIHVQDGRAFLGNGTLAGSAAVLNRCVRNAVDLAGASVQEAIRMATVNPARVIGLDRQYGLIAAGRPADLILLDDAFEVQMAMVGGEVLFSRL